MSVLGETAKVLYKTGLCSLFSIQLNGFKLKYFPTKVSKRLWIDSFRNKHTFALLDSFFTGYLKPGHVVVDAGANIGYYTLLSAATVGEDGYVYAIEAHPRTYGFLQKNVAQNSFKNIRCFHTALGDEAGEIQFSDKDKDDLNQVDPQGELSVPIIRLDELPMTHQHIDLLKVDVEGFEKFVLLGASGLLDNVDTILFESWQEHFEKFGYTLDDILTQLSQHGFKFLVHGERGFQKIDIGYNSAICEDIVAVRDVDQFLAEFTAQ